MKNFFGKLGDEEKRLDDEKSKIVEDKKLQLRKEELDIAKNRVRTGDVEISKEIVEEQKVVDVPLSHEEIVIERRAVDNEPSDSEIGDEETIHIPVSEERLEVGKHTVVTGEVSAFKKEVQESKQVKETLKREEARVHTDGDPKIINEDSDSRLH